MQSIESDVKEVISRQLGVPVDKIGNSALLRVDLGADSLDAVSVLIALEEKFDIVMSDQDAKTVKTVQDAIALIEKILAAKLKPSI